MSPTQDDVDHMLVQLDSGRKSLAEIVMSVYYAGWNDGADAAQAGL